MPRSFQLTVAMPGGCADRPSVSLKLREDVSAPVWMKLLASYSFVPGVVDAALSLSEHTLRRLNP